MEGCEEFTRTEKDTEITIFMKNGEIVAKRTKNKREEQWYRGDKLHRDDGPAKIIYSYSGAVHLQSWYQNGKVHRNDGPAYILFDSNGKPEREFWHQNGKLHRIDGPAEIYYTNGRIVEENWYQNDKEHRIDGPAKILYDDEGNKIKEVWCRDDMWARDDGPAIITYRNGKKITETWYVNKKLRVGQPAKIWFDDNGNIISQRYYYDANCPAVPETAGITPQKLAVIKDLAAKLCVELAHQ